MHRFVTGSVLLLGLAQMALLSGCLRVKSDPIRIEPIHVHVHVSVEQALDDLFLELDRASPARTLND